MTSIKKTFQVVDGLKNTPLYVEFGRWCIHRKKLEDHVLLVKHKRSKGPVAGLTRKINISDPLATLLLDLFSGFLFLPLQVILLVKTHGLKIIIL